MCRIWGWRRDNLGTLAVVLCLVIGCSSQQERAQRKAAEALAARVSGSWLTNVNKEDYASAWRSASDYFRGTITLQRWLEEMQGYRKPLGQCLDRSKPSFRHEKELDSVPDGKYIIVEYESRFEKKKKATETIVTNAGLDGHLEIYGYRVK